MWTGRGKGNFEDLPQSVNTSGILSQSSWQIRSIEQNMGAGILPRTLIMCMCLFQDVCIRTRKEGDRIDNSVSISHSSELVR